MRLKPLSMRTEEEQFARYIRTEYNKEMAMAHSSYARAAGIQSEISKVTVTRVASSEVECKRQTNVYRKDMIITVNNISREQRMLKKTMVRYNKKKRQHRIEKVKRERERLEREQRERDELEKWEQINAMLGRGKGAKAESSSSSVKEDNTGNEDTLETVSDENNNELLKSKRRHSKSNEILDNTDHPLNPFDVLPSITEAENENIPETEEANLNEDNEPDTSVSDNVLPSTADTKESGDDIISPLFTLTLRPLKPRKQIISFSDIIKLKHSHNTNKLFDMVHTLAQKHGVDESIEKRRAEKRNTKIPKGSTDAVISESLRKAASVIYPMKFGYGDHESNTKEKFDFYDEEKSEQIDSSREQVTSEPSERALTDQSKSKKFKRTKTVPGLNEELKRQLKKELLKSGYDEDRKFTNISSKSATSRFLPSIKNPASRSAHKSRSNSVSWTEAFGLLKVVHNIE